MTSRHRDEMGKPARLPRLVGRRACEPRLVAEHDSAEQRPARAWNLSNLLARALARGRDRAEDASARLHAPHHANAQPQGHPGLVIISAGIVASRCRPRPDHNRSLAQRGRHSAPGPGDVDPRPAEARQGAVSELPVSRVANDRHGDGTPPEVCRPRRIELPRQPEGRRRRDAHRKAQQHQAQCPALPSGPRERERDHARDREDEGRTTPRPRPCGPSKLLGKDNPSEVGDRQPAQRRYRRTHDMLAHSGQRERVPSPVRGAASGQR